MGRLLITILFMFTVVAGAVGGLIFETHQALGLFLIGFGIIGAAYAYIASDLKQTRGESFDLMTAKLLYGIGAESPLTGQVLKRLEKGAIHKTILKELDRALEAVPQDAQALMCYAMISVLDLSVDQLASPDRRLESSEKFLKVEQIIERGLSTGRYFCEFYTAKGVLLDIAGEYEQARRWYGEVAKLRSDPYWRLLMCTSYGMEGDYLNARYQVTKAIEEGAIGPLTDFYLGRSLASVGEYERSIPLFERVREERGDFYQLQLALRDSYWFAWHPFRASYYSILCARYAFRRSVRAGLLQILRALICFSVPIAIGVSSGTQKLARKIPYLRTSKLATISDPGNPHVSMGVALLKTKNYHAAKKMFTIAAERSSRFNVWMNLCSICNLTRDWEGAGHAYSYLAARWPGKVPKGYESLIKAQGGSAGIEIEIGPE